MCGLRPLLRRVAPKLARGLPAEVVADFFAHTWPSFSRTLSKVVVAHRVLPDLLAARAPTLLVGAWDHRDEPPRHLLAADQALDEAGVAATLRIVNGDHHLPVRQPTLIAGLLEGILNRIPPEDPSRLERPAHISDVAGSHLGAARRRSAP